MTDEQSTLPTVTADDKLAQRIVEKIEDKELVSIERVSKIRDGLRKGTLSSADWRLIAEQDVLLAEKAVQKK
jgi:hypothetical protein